MFTILEGAGGSKRKCATDVTRSRYAGGLSRELIARTALELADEQGLRALTIRGVAHRLGVEPMSIYKHLANKEAMLDGVWDEILDSVILAADHPDPTWQGYLRHTALDYRQALLAHSAVVPVMLDRTAPHRTAPHRTHRSVA